MPWRLTNNGVAEHDGRCYVTRIGKRGAWSVRDKVSGRVESGASECVEAHVLTDDGVCEWCAWGAESAVTVAKVNLAAGHGGGGVEVQRP